MLKRQFGISLSKLLAGVVVLALLAVVGFKVMPAYLEYFSIKSAIQAIAKENNGGTASDVRTNFDRRSQIDNIKSVGSNDLDVVVSGSNVYIAVTYEKIVPMVSNISLLIKFSAQAGDAPAEKPAG